MPRDFKEYYRQHWNAVRKAQKEYFKRKYTKRQAWLNELKDKPCGDCGGRFPVECMDFHHVKGKKKFEIGQGIYQKSIEATKVEVEKCIVICSNCHRIRTTKDKRGK